MAPRNLAYIALLCLFPFSAKAQVSTFNGRTGTVTLNTTDVVGALGFPAANKQGDTFSGPLNGTAGINVSAGPLAKPIQTYVSAGGTTSDNPYNIHQINIAADTISDTALPGFVNGVYIAHNFGGSTASGGRQALSVLSQLTSPTSSSNPNRNYVAATFNMIANSDHGVVGNPQGAFFAINPSAIAPSSATNILELTGGEVNIAARPGSSVSTKEGFSIIAYPDDQVHGTNFDAALMISAQNGSPIGWLNGIQFSPANGSQPMNINGTLISTSGPSAIANGIDISSYSYSGAAIRTPSFSVDGAGNISASSLSLSGFAWTNYVPQLNCGSGSPSDYTTSGRYQVLGKTVFFEMSARLITNGSCSLSMNFSLPPGAVSVAANVFPGKETATSGKMLQGVVNAGTSSAIVTAYDNSYPFVNGSIIVLSGSFEKQ